MEQDGYLPQFDFDPEVYNPGGGSMDRLSSEFDGWQDLGTDNDVPVSTPRVSRQPLGYQPPDLPSGYYTVSPSELSVLT